MFKSDPVCSFTFFKKRILFSPPALWSFIGLAFGLISPWKTWFFDTGRKPLPTFISTMQSVGNMMSPASMFLLGAYIAQGAKLGRDMLLSWKHLIHSCIFRYVILTCIGLLWSFVIMKGMDKNLFYDNPIVSFMCYTYWCLPNGIVLIAVYSVAEYYGREFGLLSIALNAVSVPIMMIFFTIYLTIYGDYPHVD